MLHRSGDLNTRGLKTYSTKRIKQSSRFVTPHAVPTRRWSEFAVSIAGFWDGPQSVGRRCWGPPIRQFAKPSSGRKRRRPDRNVESKFPSTIVNLRGICASRKFSKFIRRHFLGNCRLLYSISGPRLAQALAPGVIYRGPSFVAHYITPLIARAGDYRAMRCNTMVAKEKGVQEMDSGLTLTCLAFGRAHTTRRAGGFPCRNHIHE